MGALAWPLCHQCDRVEPAGAFYCPKNLKAINAAIGNSSLGAGDKAKVKSLSDKGFAQHKAGDHRAPVKTPRR